VYSVYSIRFLKIHAHLGLILTSTNKQTFMMYIKQLVTSWFSSKRKMVDGRTGRLTSVEMAKSGKTEFVCYDD